MIQGKVYVTKSLIDDLADAIDTKGGTSGGGTLAGLKTKVLAIPTGGGGSDVSDFIGNTFATPITYEGGILPRYAIVDKGTVQNPLVLNAPNLYQIGEGAVTHAGFFGSVISAINPKQTLTDGHKCLIDGLQIFYTADFVGSVDWSKFETNINTAGRHAYLFQDAIFDADQDISLIFNSDYVFYRAAINANLTISEQVNLATNYFMYSLSTDGNGKYYINCPKLRSITVNAANAFAYSSGIKKVTQVATSDLPNNLSTSNGITLNLPLLTAITGGSAFYQCQQIEEIDMPVITDIGGTQVFYGCYALARANLPKLTRISYRTFYLCVGLKSVYLQDITQIGEQAFYGCTALEEVILDISADTSDPLPTLQYSNAFTNSGIARGTGYIYVTDERFEELKAATNWSTWASHMKKLSELPSA
jgi:hypothetical protein